MNMFFNYDNLSEKYIPNNSTPQDSGSVETINNTLPLPFYNIRGTFLGYTWTLGDTFIWPVTVNKNIKVEYDAILFNEADMMPDKSTEGYTGQKAYNTVDIKSWTCLGTIDDTTIWSQDDTFTYPTYGVAEINLTPKIDGQLEFKIYDFRWEHIKTFSNSSDNTLLINVDKELNEMLSQGVYYGVLSVINEDKARILTKYMLHIK